jgi:hypothetical protein
MGRPPLAKKRNAHMKLRLSRDERHAIEQKRVELKIPTLAEVVRYALRNIGIPVL